MSLPTVLVLLVLLTAPAGCATLPQRPSEALRAQFGTIGVASNTVPRSVLVTGPVPGKGPGAAEGARKSALGTLRAAGELATSGTELGVLLAVPVIALTPVTTLVGSVYGAAAAESQADVEAAASVLRHTFDTAKVTESIRDHVLQLGQERTRYRFRAAGDDVDDATAEPDTILMLRLLELTLDARGINPSVPVKLVVRTDLIRVEDRRLIFVRTWNYESRAKRKFTAWASAGGAPLRDELDRAFQRLADEIVEGLFVR